jgi:predicted 5'-methylthioadenosine/S-adenosylhomocysteine nucleosidase
MLLVVAATARELEGIHAETLLCGIGPVEAAAATARSLATAKPEALLHVGLAGSREVAPPGIVIGTEAVYCDLDEELAGRFAIPRRITPDPALLAAAVRALPEAVRSPIGTSGAIGGVTWSDVEAMEGFAVLRAAQLAGVPALELRAISNDPDEADRGKWQFDEAFAALADATERVLAALASA